jgi:hypothetical protein
MPAAQGPPPDLGSIGVLIALAACLCVAYWRTALRIVAILIIILACYGAVLILVELHIVR